MAKVNCPLMGGKIDDVICFDIHMVVEGMAPEFTAPKKAIDTYGYREICLECPNHRED
jgi:hypothetical protein